MGRKDPSQYWVKENRKKQKKKGSCRHCSPGPEGDSSSGSCPCGKWQCPFLTAAMSVTLLWGCCEPGAPSTAIPCESGAWAGTFHDRATHPANTNSQLHHLAAARGASTWNTLLRLLQITTFVVFKTWRDNVSIKPQQVTARTIEMGPKADNTAVKMIWSEHKQYICNCYEVLWGFLFIWFVFLFLGGCVWCFLDRLIGEMLL